LFVALGAFAVCGGAETARRPNIVVMLTDDQRWDAVGVVQRALGERGRFPWLRAATPNMDRIAAEGFRFRNAFTVSALCSPSRAAFLTGRYNHLNGVANNRTPRRPDKHDRLGRRRQHGLRGRLHPPERGATVPGDPRL
jgi:arylsulfatase A-like enzyme